MNFSNVPTPLDVIHALWTFFQLSTAFEHVESSVFRVVVGFVLAALIGVGIGLLAGRYQKLAAFLMPPLEVLRPIPAVAWIPLAILIFPSSEASMIFITFIGALFPILLNTVHGVGAVDPRLVASAKSLGASDLAIIYEVIIPGITEHYYGFIYWNGDLLVLFSDCRNDFGSTRNWILHMGIFHLAKL